MNTFNHILLKRVFFTFLLLLFISQNLIVCAEPASYNKSNIVWNKTVDSRSGRYVSKSGSVFPSVSLTLDGAYYYGDNENPGFAWLKQPSLVENIGGMAKLNYSQPITSLLNIRYSVGGGLLRGSNEKYADKVFATDQQTTYRKFQSWILNAAVGVEIFPIPDNGFYIYAGILFNYSNVNTHYGKLSPETDWLFNWNNNSFLPMIPIEVGYQFSLNNNWMMNVHIGISQGFGDTDVLNLDGFPHKFPDEIRGTGSFAGYRADGTTTGRFFDGWFNVGITFSYSWHKCEVCRLLKW